MGTRTVGLTIGRATRSMGFVIDPDIAFRLTAMITRTATSMKS
jgi:hypothetical protein